MKNILITRAKDRSHDMVRTLESEGFSTFLEPLFTVKNIFIAKEEFLQISAIIVTSYNACDALIKFDLPKKTKIFVVGDRTAQKISEFGFTNIIISAENSAASLKDLIIKSDLDKSGLILYFHGPIISLDFAEELKDFDFRVKKILSYQLEEVSTFSSELLDFSKKASFDEVLLFSQNSAKIFLKLAKHHNLLEFFTKSKLLCFSEKILSEVRSLGFANSAIFKENSILEKFYDQNYR